MQTPEMNMCIRESKIRVLFIDIRTFAADRI